jgi:hypothetical protein
MFVYFVLLDYLTFFLRKGCKAVNEQDAPEKQIEYFVNVADGELFCCVSLFVLNLCKQQEVNRKKLCWQIGSVRLYQMVEEKKF